MSCELIPGFWFAAFGAVLLIVAWVLCDQAERMVREAKRLYAEAADLAKQVRG